MATAPEKENAETGKEPVSSDVKTAQPAGNAGAGLSPKVSRPSETNHILRMLQPINVNKEATLLKTENEPQETEQGEKTEKPSFTRVLNSTNVEEPDESEAVPYGSDIAIFEELNDQQKERYQWDLAFQMFRDVNKGVPVRTLSQWIRKQLILGWTVNDGYVPDIRQIVITPVTHYWKGKPFEILYVQAYSFDEAYAATGDYSGFWYWITPILGTKSVIQQHGSVTKYNRKTFGNLDAKAQLSLIDRLYGVSGDKVAYEKARNSGWVGGLEFAALVKSVQRKFWGNDPERVTGMLSPLTLEKVEHITEATALEKTQSFKDTEDILLSKLFYISGDLSLYRSAMNEKQANELAGAQQKHYEARKKLIKSAPGSTLRRLYTVHR